MNDSNSHFQAVRCPQCGGPAFRYYDKDLRATGERFCPSMTCLEFRFWHIPSAQEVEASARVLRPMHKADLDRSSQ
jgi:hypothetical protein